MKAGLYARVSREEQAEGYSIDAQLDAMRKFCKDHGWTIAKEYIEPGVSGTTEDRPAFREIISDCEDGRMDVLVTHQLDRFFRNLQLQLETLGQLGQWGVSYVSVVEQIDYSTPQGMLFLSMLGAFNEYYVANLRRETKKGKLGRAKKGLSNASLAPYGYDHGEGDVNIVNAEEAKVVETIFGAYATGDHSDTTVAEMLNEKEIPPAGRARSGRWTREGVRYILNNPYYIGRVRYGDDLYPGMHDPIIDKKLWDAAHKVRTKRTSTRQRGGGYIKRVHLLSKIAKCNHCDAPLRSQASWGKGRSGIVSRYYFCPSRRRSIDCDSGASFVPQEEIDEQIANLIDRLRPPDSWRDMIEEQLKSQDADKDTNQHKRKRLENKLDRLNDLYVDGEISRSDYQKRKQKLERQLTDLKTEKGKPTEENILEAGEVLAVLHEEWPMAPKEYRRDILRTIFESVYIDTIEHRLVSVVPHDDFVELFRMDGLWEYEGRFYLKRPDKLLDPQIQG